MYLYMYICCPLPHSLGSVGRCPARSARSSASPPSSAPRPPLSMAFNPFDEGPQGPPTGGATTAMTTATIDHGELGRTVLAAHFSEDPFLAGGAAFDGAFDGADAFGPPAPVALSANTSDDPFGLAFGTTPAPTAPKPPMPAAYDPFLASGGDFAGEYLPMPVPTLVVWTPRQWHSSVRKGKHKAQPVPNPSLTHRRATHRLR